MKIALALLFLAGCIRAPEIVMVDRATALEQQASGSFDELEQDVSVKGLNARSLPLTPAQLVDLGIMPAPIIDQTELTEADRIDALLRQRCIGEANDGLLADTHESCIGAADRDQALVLVDRTNRARVQLWHWMAKQRPNQSVDALRAKWRAQHARAVVCRAWLQKPDGSWGPKEC